jgi:hypothetical protein
MSQDLETYLQTALQKLEKAYSDHMKTKIYDQDSEKLKILIELIKEQLPHENIGPATR